jgi:predicted permease
MPQDLRIAIRGLLRARGLAVTIVLSVGLGIGAATAIFAIVDAALLRPLPYTDPEQLVRFFNDSPASKFRFSVADYQGLAAQRTRFTKVAAFADRPMTYIDGGNAERLTGRQVSATYFDTLGITPALGRNFTEEEARFGGPPSVIVGDLFWRRRLAAAKDVIGKTMNLDGVSHVIVGVLPPATGPLEAHQDFFVAAQWEPPRRRGPFMLTAIGRVPAAARAAADAELKDINGRLFPVRPGSNPDQRATWSMTPLKTLFTGDFPKIAAIALAAAALVWLIACVNASNLLVARTTSRSRELAVRTVLGASRGRVMASLLAESAVLALAAATLGCGLSWVAISLAKTAGAPYIPRAEEIVLGGRTLFVLVITTAASVCVFGLIPAVHGAGGRIDEALRSGGRASTGNRAARTLRGFLVACQFAVATPLLVIAGMLIASLTNLGRVDVGFNTHDVLTGAIMLPQAHYRDAGSIIHFWSALRDNVARLPGVTAVAFTTGRPPAEAGERNDFDLEERPAGSTGSHYVTAWVRTTPEYIRLLGLRLVEGRLWDARDAEPGSDSTVIVDEAWARRFFSGRSAVGRRLKSGGCAACEWTTVIGVVSGVRYEGLDERNQGVVYAPIVETGDRLPALPTSRTRYLVVRTASSAAALIPQVQRVLRDIDPDVPLARVATIDELVDRSLEQPRGLSVLVGALAVVALALSVVGIYGVMTHYVQQQARDISIRLALGGSPRRVMQLMVVRGMQLVVWGLAAGVAAAGAFARLLSASFFGVNAADPRTFAAVTLLMAGAALLACGIPAWRAVSVEPAVVLRTD